MRDREKQRWGRTLHHFVLRLGIGPRNRCRKQKRLFFIWRKGVLKGGTVFERPFGARSVEHRVVHEAHESVPMANDCPSSTAHGSALEVCSPENLRLRSFHIADVRPQDFDAQPRRHPHAALFGLDEAPALDREARVVPRRGDLDPLPSLARVGVPEDAQEALLRPEPLRVHEALGADRAAGEHRVLVGGGAKVSELIGREGLGASHEHIVCKFDSLQSVNGVHHEWI